jgi:hypothetical protein
MRVVPRAMLAVLILTSLAALARAGGPPPAGKPMTVSEFVCTFKPACGCASYQVLLIHPCTGCPVQVCFRLPGCPRRIKCGKNTVVFRYGLFKKAVVLCFECDGTVRVRD